MANRKASRLVAIAVRDGFLPALNTLKCLDCGEQATDYDHRNYDYPLSVDAVCHSCNITRGKASGSHDGYVQPNNEKLLDDISKSKRDVRVSFRLSEKENDDLNEIVKNEGITVSQWVRKEVREEWVRDKVRNARLPLPPKGFK